MGREGVKFAENRREERIVCRSLNEKVDNKTGFDSTLRLLRLFVAMDCTFLDMDRGARIVRN